MRYLRATLGVLGDILWVAAIIVVFALIVKYAAFTIPLFLLGWLVCAVIQRANGK